MGWADKEPRVKEAEVGPVELSVGGRLKHGRVIITAKEKKKAALVSVDLYKLALHVYVYEHHRQSLEIFT